MQNDIGQRIRKLRKAHSPAWTMNHLAGLADIDPGQLSRAERGLAGLSLPAMARIATLLKVSLATLIDPEHSLVSDQHESLDMLVDRLINKVLASLNEQQWQQCNQGECDLIHHHIRSAIEEGIKRGQIQAERELNITSSSSNPNYS